MSIILKYNRDQHNERSTEENFLPKPGFKEPGFLSFLSSSCMTLSSRGLT